MAILQASFLRQREYLAVAITHFFIDVLNSSRTLLVAILAVGLGLTNAQVGIALLLYNVGNALSQPLFGLLADRIGARLLVVGGMGWMIAFYGLAALLPDWPALIALTVAGLGSGAFHPTGTMVASQASDENRTQATAVFFMSGQLGLFTGPILAGLVLQLFDRPGYLILPAMAMIAFVSGWQWISGRHVAHHAPASGDESAAAEKILKPARPHNFWRRVVLLSIIIVTLNTVSISTINYAPKLFTELGYAAAYVGILSGLLMLGSAGGGLVGGTLADRRNGRFVIILAAAAAILPVFFYIPSGGAARFTLLLLAGFFVGMPHSILVLMTQGLLPGRRGFASGLALGFMFFSGSVGSYVVGLVADQIGLSTALQYMAVLLFVTIGATLLLPRAQAPQPAKAAQTA